MELLWIFLFYEKACWNISKHEGANIQRVAVFYITDNIDLSLEYQYRHEGVSDYITSPVNIPELIRRICYFVEE